MGLGGWDEDLQDPHWHLSSARLPVAIQWSDSSTIYWQFHGFCWQRSGKPSHYLTVCFRELSPRALCLGEKPSPSKEVEAAPLLLTGSRGGSGISFI